ncbi:hypothetical protein QM480_21005 [Flectobacillus sp. DC10W]|uniref:Outer membrane protein beta-barrel domain-containing protein n=1 Tax=Flectobacillus longus TaxID=2984207 RepID=A0ABT6YUL5_9BACT|nr:hypothetical protein [Flectobacillus longus]MDI9866831.1 hypothetical protein [Flectobacillus longus]
MKKHLLKLLFLLLTNQLMVIGQDVGELKKLKSPKQMLKGKGISIKGSLSGTYNMYHANGLENRQSPYNYMFTGNIMIDIFNKIKMPVSFSYINQQASYVNPLSTSNLMPFGQPFNRISLKPKYKSVQLFLGTVSQTFTPYTLAGHRYQGVDLTFKDKDFPLYGSLMFGTLNQKVNPDTISPNKPSYQRKGMGIQLGYKIKQDFIELSMFSARDSYQPADMILDKYNLTPMSNMVSSIRFAKQLIKKFVWETEMSVSALSSDIRAVKNTNENFFKSFGGLYNTNASTSYFKAIHSSINYKSESYQVGAEYKRIEPKYQTFGSYYFVNDLELFGVKASGQMLDKKISLMGEIAQQHDNLDQTKPQTSNRIVGSLSVVYAPNDKVNLNASYSNFTAYSNFNPSLLYLAKARPLEALDTLNYRQVNQNIQANALWQLPSNNAKIHHQLTSSTVFQLGNAVLGGANNNNQLENINLTYGSTNEILKQSWSAGINYTQVTAPTLSTSLWGPMCSIAKSFLKEKLKLSLSGNYTFSSTLAILSSAQKANMLTTRLSSNYALSPNGILQLNASLLSKQSPSNESDGANFTELSFNIGYRHTFSVVDLKFK